MKIKYKNKNYCLSKCAKDKFQNYIIGPISFVLAFIGILLVIFGLLWISGLIISLITFYGFNSEFLITNMSEFIGIGCSPLIGIFIYFRLKEFVTSIYNIIKRGYLNYGDRQNIKIFLFSVLTPIVITLIGAISFVLFLMNGTYMWFVTVDSFLVNFLILGILITGLAALLILSLVIIYHIPAIFKGLLNLFFYVKEEINEKLNTKYETKYRKECKLFEVCE